MFFDFFISYLRRDNEQGRIAQLVERISADFGSRAKRLVPFFDQQEIAGMQKTGGSASFRASANRDCCSRAFLRCISKASIANSSLSNN